MIQGDGDPHKGNVPTQQLAKDEGNKHADAPNADKRNHHGHIAVAGGAYCAVIDLGQVLGNLGEAHDKDINPTDGLDFRLVGEQRHKAAGKGKQGHTGRQTSEKGKFAHLLEIGPVKLVVPHADGPSGQGGRGGDKADARHFADHLRLQTKIVSGEGGAAIAQDDVAQHNGRKLPKDVFTGGGHAGFINFFQNRLIQGEKGLAVMFVAKIPVAGIE